MSFSRYSDLGIVPSVSSLLVQMEDPNISGFSAVNRETSPQCARVPTCMP